MIRYKCNKCGAAMESSDEMAGKMGICPACGRGMRVPVSGPQAGKSRGAGEQVKSFEFDVPVTTKEGKQIVAARCRPGEKVYLYPDPKNKDNPYAVGVCLMRRNRQVQVGWVPDEHTQSVARRLLTGWRYHATVDRILSRGGILGFGKKHALRIAAELSAPGTG